MKKVAKTDIIKKKQVFLITAIPYMQDIVVVINGQVSDAIKYYKKQKTKNADENVKELESSNLYEDRHEIGEDGAQTYTKLPNGYLVVLSHSSNWVKTVSTVSHECLHLTHYILRDAGIILSEESEEAYTYLQAYLLGNILRKIF